MSTLSLRLPNSIHRHIKQIALEEGVSINQFISTAVSEKISALTTENYLAQRAKRADRSAFRDILDKVPDRTPLPGDEITPENS
ncbi:MAG: toxin-antitoxin system HicB family antitoxin [Candidatus Electrothrix sp. AR4]|nr:toxin-antitoxin system HicB family antitoxin [Candidatus Electrothrix sp. AR4]